MKITQKGPADADLTQLVKKEKISGPAQPEGDVKAHQSSGSARVSISPEARHLQRIAELARTGDELRAERVKKIKEEIDSGAYHADSIEVSKSIVRGEVARLLDKK